MKDSFESAAVVGPPHIAVLPTPGMGHLIPLAEFVKRLDGFTVTFITLAASNSKAQRAFLESLPPSVSSVSLPPVSLADVPPDAAIETLISISTVRSIPALKAVLLDLKKSTNFVAYVADLFGADTFSVAREIGVPPYYFHPSNFMMLSLMLQLPELDATISGEFRDLPEPVRLPGCVPIPGADLLNPLQDRKNDCYKWMVHHGERYRDAEGILVNTVEALEPWAAEFFYDKNKPGWPPVYPVGPMVRSVKNKPIKLGGLDCLEWLDRQPAGSVLYMSFGSGGTLSTVQTTEVALGLEMSGQRFVWVVRSPDDADPSATFFSSGLADDPFGFLPGGFADRIKGTGLLVPSWAPQVQVLAHAATGGFLSHCGWNSTLESISHGVPMIAWPLFAEQRQNAVMLAEGAKVAIRMRADVEGFYSREEIAKAVRELMEGEEGKAARRRAAELKSDAATATAEGGSSYEALNEVVSKWKGSAAVVV